MSRLRNRLHILWLVGLIILGGLVVLLAQKQQKPITRVYQTVLQAKKQAITMSQKPASELVLTSKRDTFTAQEKPTFRVRVGGVKEARSMKHEARSFAKKIKNFVTAHADTPVEVPRMAISFQRTTEKEKTFPGEITKAENGEVQIAPIATMSFMPGKYTLTVASGDRNIEQDFYWGVLAVNTNKSIYIPGETAQIGMAVLDDFGRTKCITGDTDFMVGKVWLTIIAPDGSKEVLSTENKKIIGSGECYERSVTNTPDFKTTYKTRGEGVYKMHVEGQNQNGKRSIDDTFTVQANEPFIVERSSFPTRIYPAKKYPTVLKITANEAFTGDIVERTPAYFTIDCQGCDIQGKNVEYDPQDSNLRRNIHALIWHVSLQKGETKVFTYTFEAPHVSPEFFLLGPVAFYTNRSQEVLFQESRQWQIASDAVVTWDGGGGADTNWNTAANWSSDNLCTAADEVCTFDNTSDNNATINLSITVQGIDINSGYDGTITQSSTYTISLSTSGFDQASGTFAGGSGAVTLSGVSTSDYNVTGGTHTTTSGTTGIFADLTWSAGSFTNAGTIDFKDDGSTLLASTITCSGTIDGTVREAETNYAAAFTLGSGCTITTFNAASSAKAGLFTVNGTMTFNSGTLSLYQNSASLGSSSSLTINSGAVLALQDDFTIASGGSLSNSGTIRFYDDSGAVFGSVITCSTTIGGTVQYNKTIYAGALTVGAGCTITTLTTSAGIAGDVTINGAATMTSGTLSIYQHNLIIGSAGVLTINNGVTVKVQDDLTITSGGSISNSGTIEFYDDSGAVYGSVVTCTSTTIGGTMKLSKSIYAGAFTVSVGCTVTGLQGSGTTKFSDFTFNGTVTLTSGTLNGINGDLLVGASGSLTIDNGATINFYDDLTVTTGGTITNNGSINIIDDATYAPTSTLTCNGANLGNFTVNKANYGASTALGSDCTTANFTRTVGLIGNPASAYTLKVQGNLSLSSTTNIGGANMTISMEGSGTQTINFAATSTTFVSKFQVNKSGGTASLITNNLTVTGQTCTIVEGTFSINGKNLTCATGFTVEDGGNFQLWGTTGIETYTIPTLNSGSTVTYVGDGDASSDTITVTTNMANYHHLTIASTDTQDTYQLGVALDCNGSFTVNSGSTFTTTGTNYNMTIGGSMTNNGTMTLNSNTVTLDTTTTGTITGSGTPAITFNNLTIATANKTVQFGTGKTIKINGIFTITGTVGNNIQIKSDSAGSRWKVDKQGTSAVTYATVTDSGCADNTKDILMDTTNSYGGNNEYCWRFTDLGTRSKGPTRIQGPVRIVH